jgi:hypothetical protein
MKTFCQYKDVLGVPKKGIHSYRVMNIAIVDVLLTFLLSFIVTKINHISFWYNLLALFLLGILLHRIFCVKTTLDELLFSS